MAAIANRSNAVPDFALAVLVTAFIAAITELWVAGRNRAWLTRHHGPCPARSRTLDRTQLLAARILALSVIAALAAGGAAEALVTHLGAEAALAIAVLALPAVDLALSFYDAQMTCRRSGRATPGLDFITGRIHVPSLALGLPLIVAVAWAVEAAQSAWWLPAGMAWLAVVIGRELRSKSPSPAAPMPPTPISARLSETAAAAGLPGIPILVGQSAHPDHANARAEGILAWRRVVLDDNLLKHLSDDEIVAVYAHEAGHLTGRHRELFALWRWVAGMALVLTASGLNGDGVVTACLVVVAAPVYAFLLAPAENAMIRQLEFAADRMAVKLAGPTSMTSALQRLAHTNQSLPSQHKLHSAFHSPHPSLQSRLTRIGIF